MRIYIVAGTIGTGITEVCTELRMETFRRGYRAGRMVLGRPDRIFIDGNLTAEEVIQRVQEFMNNARAVPTEIIMSGTEITKHALAIRANWPSLVKMLHCWPIATRLMVSGWLARSFKVVSASRLVSTSSCQKKQAHLATT